MYMVILILRAPELTGDPPCQTTAPLSSENYFYYL